MAQGKLLSFRAELALKKLAKMPAVPTEVPSEPSFVCYEAPSPILQSCSEPSFTRSPAPSPSSRAEQSFASDTWPPAPPFMPSEESCSEVSFTTLISGASSTTTEYPGSEETTDNAFLHEESSLASCSDLPKSLRPVTSTTLVSTGVQVSPPTLVSSGVQATPAPATVVSAGIQTESDPAATPSPSFLQRCWDWIDSKIRSWLF
jgi:hypothetical protein